LVYLSKYQSHHNSPTLHLILQNIDQEKKPETGSYLGFQLNYDKHFTKCNFGTVNLSITRTHCTNLYINFVNSFVKNPIVNKY